MNSVFPKTITAYFDNLVVGPPFYNKTGKLENMVAYPLFPTLLSENPTKIITLDEALNNGLDLIDTGIISQVNARNDLPAPILVTESKIILGDTQERSVQFSCILPARDTTSVAVTCVEEGQPSIPRVNFTNYGACPWPIRSFKNEQLARNGEPNQFWVWERIRKYLNDTATKSTTHSLSATLKKQTKDLKSLSNSYPINEGQIGVIFSVGNNLYVEAFSDPELFSDSYEIILFSALTEALSLPSNETVPPDKIQHLFDRINNVMKNANILKNSVKHTGQTLAFREPFLSGQALFANNKLMHLSSHQRCFGKSKIFSKLESDLVSAQIKWKKSPPVFLHKIQSASRDRKSCYDIFKKKVKRSSGSKRTSLQKFNSQSGQHLKSQSEWNIQPFSTKIFKLFSRAFSDTHD